MLLLQMGSTGTGTAYRGISSNVELTIYNILGEKIQTLLNKTMPAGYHEITFDGQNLSSGVYLYRIDAGTWTDTKKMFLVK